MNYKVIISDIADSDIQELHDVIAIDFASPITAARYIQGVIDTVKSLEKFPHYAIRHNLSLLRFGTDVRRINYKKIAIIYTIHGDVVYIHRIIASASITEL